MSWRRSTPGPTLAIAAAAVLWGLWWIPLRALQAGGLAGDWASIAIYGLGALALLPVAWLRRRRLRAGGAPLLAVGLLFGGTLVTWNHAVLTGEVVRVSLLFYLAPVWGTILAAAVFGERVNAARLASVVIGISGALVVLGLDAGLPLPRNEGEWMGLASGLLFALAATFARIGRGHGWFERTFASLPVAAVIAVGFVLFLPAGPGLAPIDLAGLWPMLIAATLAWHLPSMALVLWGAGRLGPARVSILMLIEIVAAAISAALWAGEPFGWREGVGCVLILVAGALEAAGHRPSPSA